MAYDLERHREKRERVLGVQRKAFTFGRLSTFFAAGIVIFISIIIIPQMISFFQNRNLDDVIYRLQNNMNWPAVSQEALEQLPGVVNAVKDEKNHRLILTFNRDRTQPTAITAILKQKDIDVVQLNVINHIQRLTNLKREAEFEAL